MLEPANPRDGALEPESEPRVHERPVLAQLEIPIVRVERQPLVLDSRHETIVIIFAL